MDASPVAVAGDGELVAVSRCPIDHTALAAGCPVRRGSDGPALPVRRSRADEIVRAVLRVRERPAGLTAVAAQAAFQRSMMISALRCTLTYVVFPFVLPAVGFATGVGPVVGLVIGIVAITCDVFAVRRFFAVDHRWRWPVGAVCLSVISLLSVLLVQDVVHLVT